MKLTVNKGLKCKKSERVRFKNYERKIKSPFMIYADFDSILGQKIMGNKIQMSLIRTNIKKILLAVTATNQYVLRISLVSLLSHT